jgi:type I restriction enzyme M protein
MTDPSPKLRRRALETLSRDSLATVTAKLGLEVEDRRSQASHVEAILKAKATPFGDVLRLLTREDLKAICEALGLDTAGKEKEPIVQRILAADKLRNNMDAAEYKHVVLGLIFLKYISDAFEELHARQGRVAEPSLPARSRRPSGPGMLTGPKRAHLVLLGSPHTPPLF